MLTDKCVFVVLGLVSSVLSQQIGWENCLWNDLFCVEWDAKAYSLTFYPMNSHIRENYSGAVEKC